MTNRHLRHFTLRHLRPDSLPDAMCGMALLARRLAVGFQDGVDEGNQRPDYRPLALGPLALRRLGARQCLTHHPAVDGATRRPPSTNELATCPARSAWRSDRARSAL